MKPEPRVSARHGTASQMRAKMIVRAAVGRAIADGAIVETVPRVPGTAFYIELPMSSGQVQPVAFPGARAV